MGQFSKTGQKDEEGDRYDKLWAHKYILEPLTTPEPYQVTGPGSSHYNPHRLSVQSVESVHSEHRYSSAYREQLNLGSSPSPSSISFTSVDSDESDERRSSVSYSSPPPAGKPRYRRSQLPPPPSVAFAYPVSAPNYHRRHRPQMMQNPVAANPESNFHPTNPFHSPRPSAIRAHSSQDYAMPHNRSQSESVNHNKPRGPRQAPNRDRARSFGERFPGDMSHRPLDLIKSDNRAADRHHRHRPRISDTDMIDALDTIGGMYHHGGPYDATLRSRNLDPKTSPVEAVKESNLAALRATPPEYVVDSLRHHVPLQGTSTIPSGEYDYRGSRMSYEEGADLMRDPDAPGGPYKRWTDTKYLPEDLKGKGEPSYSLERALKEKQRSRKGEPEEIEMQSGFQSRSHHSKSSKPQRSVTVSLRGSSSSTGNAYNNSDLQRRNSTGKKLSNSLKRRWGSIRGRK